MTRSIFGWSLPPGAAGDPFAPWNQEEGPCAVCAKPVADCCCPECPVCTSTGDPKCYHEHGLELVREQVIGRQEARVALAEETLGAAKFALDLLKNGGAFSPNLADDPDPYK